MENSSVDIILVLGAFAGMLAGFFAIVKYIIGQNVTDRDSDRKERIDLSKAIKDMANSNKLIADAAETGNREAKERNGHLGQQTIELANMVQAQAKDIKRVAENTGKTASLLSKSAIIAAEDREELLANNQVVHEQKVERQIVAEKA